MKRVAICLAASLLLIAAASQAAPVDTKAGTKAMVFQFSGLSNLGVSGYQGGIGMRYYLNDGMALRPGVDFNFGNSSTKGGAGFTDDKANDLGFGLSLALEKHMKGPENISPYMGLGAGFSMSSTSDQPTVPDPTPAGTHTKHTVSSTGFNLFGMLGFEWGFAENMTLGGEYRLGFGYASGKVEDEYIGAATVKSDETSGFGLGVSTASVYLSVG